MALETAAKRMAAEFDFDKTHVNKAVKKFLDEMEEGLEKQGTHMSQIPTYVTAVPNGTEKVGTRNIGIQERILILTGNIPSCRLGRH